MSIFANGTFHFKDNMSVFDLIDFSYFALGGSIDNRIGFVMGGNAVRALEDKVISKFSPIASHLAFSLTDDPIDMCAECLFAPDGVEISVNGKVISNDMSFTNRLKRIEHFFEVIFSYDLIDRIILNISAEETDDISPIYVTVDEFTSSIKKSFDTRKTVEFFAVVIITKE